MGRLSKYKDPDCPFCSLISKAIGRAWGDSWDPKRRRISTGTSCRLFIQSRSPVSIYGNGRVQRPQPRILLATDQEPPNFHHNKTPTRRIDRVKLRFIIAEIESLSNESATNYLPRLPVEPYISIALLKSWLEECQKHEHSRKILERGANDLFQPQKPFRLIDVIEESLVQRDEKCDYMALSYVWGPLPTLLDPGDDYRDQDIPILLTLQQNMEELSVPGSLSESRVASRRTGRIPRTVRDAMELTRQMGMRYLWVDTLCIVQDDPEDRTRLIRLMGYIYNCATATIIAAAGNDADAGLRGVSSRTGRPIEPTKIVDDSDGTTTLDLSLSLLSLCEEIRMTTWNTRGWAFQEQSLSRRCLYFTADEVFFTCSETQRREGYDYAAISSQKADFRVRTGPPWWTRNLRRDLDPTPYYYLGDKSEGGLGVQVYQTAVQEYSRKNLTLPSDVFNAFEGIFNRFERSGHASEVGGIRQMQGIPFHLLYQAILWFPLENSEKRFCEPGKFGEPDERFSTWSWASWVGPVEFVFADNCWLPRNISQAPIKRVPIYVPILCWYYGSPAQRFWTRDIWETTCGVLQHRKLSNTCFAQTNFDEFVRTEKYLKDRVGIDVSRLLGWLRNEKVPRMNFGELGFFGPYLAAQDFQISSETDGHVRILNVSTHRGEFRFDGDVEKVDELVAVVAADTTAKPPNTQSILLDSVKPQWQYRFFRVQ
ncbi:HET-domain-containing protein, partial [Biscogniauxia mediterranea]